MIRSPNVMKVTKRKHTEKCTCAHESDTGAHVLQLRWWPAVSSQAPTKNIRTHSSQMKRLGSLFCWKPGCDAASMGHMACVGAAPARLDAVLASRGWKMRSLRQCYRERSHHSQLVPAPYQPQAAMMPRGDGMLSVSPACSARQPAPLTTAFAQAAPTCRGGRAGGTGASRAEQNAGTLRICAAASSIPAGHTGSRSWGSCLRPSPGYTASADPGPQAARMQGVEGSAK